MRHVKKFVSSAGDGGCAAQAHNTVNKPIWRVTYFAGSYFIFSLPFVVVCARCEWRRLQHDPPCWLQMRLNAFSRTFHRLLSLALCRAQMDRRKAEIVAVDANLMLFEVPSTTEIRKQTDEVEKNVRG